MRICKFNKIFGVGPIGLVISVILLLTAFFLGNQVGLPKISEKRFALDIIFGASLLAAISLVWWSIESLPVSDRGKVLCTWGPFKYVRHPLYAAFLSILNFGFALFLNNYIFLVWAIILHPIWHYLVRYEENLMIDLFRDAYKEYQKRTGRFFPKLL